jgi:N6-adenosine-specific RNA methylase IME4
MTIPYHPLAELFPLMEGVAFDELVADIKANGLVHPLTVCDGMLLDGRNRLRACAEAGVQPIFDVYDGPDPLAFVLSQNVARRHLDASQRAMIAAKLANIERIDTLNRGSRPAILPIGAVSQPEAAERLHVSPRSLRSAKVVLERGGPAVIAAVEKGRVPVACAIEIIGLELNDEDLTDLLSLPPSDIPSNVERLKKEHKRREVVRRIRAQADAAPEWPQGRFSVFYVDPAWEDDFGHTKRDVEHHYPTMSLDEIKALPVDEIATPDAVLYLWAVPHMVHKALEVMARWGFEYRTIITWGKDSIGLGQWVRNQTEHLLVGRRGDFPPPPEELRSPSLVMGKKGEHSAKPDVFAEMIERWYPDFVKVELFRRGPPRPGWSVWGSEAKAAE